MSATGKLSVIPDGVEHVVVLALLSSETNFASFALCVFGILVTRRNEPRIVLQSNRRSARHTRHDQ